MGSAFEWNDTQRMLCESLDRLLTARHGLHERLVALETPQAGPPLWSVLASELGLLGATFPEALGGAGGAVADGLVLMEVLGRHLAAEPYLSTIVLGGRLLALHADRDLGARALLAQVVAGQAVLALATTEPQGRHAWHDVRTRLELVEGGYRLTGRKAVVHSAPWATHLLVIARSHGQPQDRDGISLVCLPMDTPGIQRRDYRTLDGAWASDIAFENVPVSPGQLLGAPGEALPCLEQVQDEATLAVCAEACGLLSRLLDDTIAYVRQRQQFGVPIASFQVLRHRIADMFMALEQAKALTAASVSALDASPAQRARAVSSAKVCVARACRTVGQGAVQLHGGMGMTDELAVGHCFRRATQIAQSFGSEDHHLARVAQLEATAEPG